MFPTSCLKLIKDYSKKVFLNCSNTEGGDRFLVK